MVGICGCFGAPKTKRDAKSKNIEAASRLIQSGRLARARQVLGGILASVGDGAAATLESVRAKVMLADAFHREGGKWNNVEGSCQNALLYAEAAVRDVASCLEEGAALVRAEALMVLGKVWREYPHAAAAAKSRKFFTDALEALREAGEDADAEAERLPVREATLLARAYLADKEEDLAALYAEAFDDGLRVASDIEELLKEMREPKE